MMRMRDSHSGGWLTQSALTKGDTWNQSYVTPTMKRILGIGYFAENIAVLTSTVPIRISAMFRETPELCDPASDLHGRMGRLCHSERGKRDRADWFFEVLAGIRGGGRPVGPAIHVQDGIRSDCLRGLLREN